MNTLPAPYSTLVAKTKSPTTLDQDTRYPEAWHRWSDSEVRAVIHAWASGRPLLVRGEAGCGKSQLARAVAAVLTVPLETEVIHPRYEASDLLYREDPVKRLAQAQLLAAVKTQDLTPDEALVWLESKLLPKLFVTEGPIWRAMKAAAPTGAERSQASWPRAVVLIDEIDKADSDVPNALLDILGNRSFVVPASGEVVNCGEAHRPLIIITTNEDRELPPAFVRRCAVLNLKPKDAAEADFCGWLVERANAHSKLKPLAGDATSPMARAAAQVWADRMAAKREGLPTVGLAEYLDLLYSLLNLSEAKPERANALLDQLSPFALVKHQQQQQDRPPHGAERTGD
jgi:MoxR-like ATPase